MADKQSSIDRRSGAGKALRVIGAPAVILYEDVLRPVGTILYEDVVLPLRAFMRDHPMWPIAVPALLILYFVYVSLGWNVWVSVSDWEAGSLTATYGWGGFDNYVNLFRTEFGNFPTTIAEFFTEVEFVRYLGNTLLLFSIIPICLVLGLFLALLMDAGLRGTTLFRNLILLPFALSFVVTGTVWSWMYRPTDGILNSFLQMLSIDTTALTWVSRDDMAMIAVIIALVWQFSGYVAVIFLAAIKGVPENIINAARLDGAYSVRIYWKLIIPQLKGALGSCITILAMYALRSFDFIVTLVGYTKSVVTTLPIAMYNEAFAHNNFASSAAISCFLLALVLVLILPLTYWTNRRK